MNHKGFTLTEILGVLIILAMVVLLVAPVVSKSINNNKKKLYDIQIQNIEKAAKDYATKKTDILPNNGQSIKITLGDLKRGGFITEEVRNPITKELFPDDLQIAIANNNDRYTYKVVKVGS